VLFVDASQVLHEISPFVYGSNYGPWSFVPLDLIPAAEQAGLGFLRFPGGNWGDQNDITEIQLDNFISLARNLGAEPSISVRLRGGTPQAAAELVSYANVEKGYGVKYWSIGNEPEFYQDYDTARYNREWRQIAEAMRAVDPSILLMGPEVSQYRGNPFMDPHDNSLHYWMDEFLKTNGDLVDIVSIHRYPFPTSLNSGPTEKRFLGKNPSEWDEIIPNLRNLIHELTGRDLPVAVTEFNSHWNAVTGGEASPDSHYNAIWLADVLGHLIRQNIEIAAQFALQSSSANGGWGLFSRVDPRPSYYVYRMYAQFGNQLVYSASGVDKVSVYAALRGDGSLTVMIINLNSAEQAVPLEWQGDFSGQAEEWLFDLDHSADDLGAVHLENGGELLLPPESILLFLLAN
jgi:hypothetical protein